MRFKDVRPVLFFLYRRVLRSSIMANITEIYIPALSSSSGTHMGKIKRTHPTVTSIFQMLEHGLFALLRLSSIYEDFKNKLV